MARRPVVDPDVCAASGVCEQICPEVFRVSQEKGYSEMINPSGCPEATIQEAIDACPVQAISWKDS